MTYPGEPPLPSVKLRRDLEDSGVSILSNYARQRMMERCFGSESYTAPKHGHHTLLGAFGWALWDALTPLTGEEKLVSKWPDWSTNWPQS